MSERFREAGKALRETVEGKADWCRSGAHHPLPSAVMVSFDAEATRQDQRGDMLHGSYGNSVCREEKKFTVRYRKLLIGRP
ncbi:hypothetical protein GTX53_11065 [Streptomyces sp. SID5594]|uniref:hypothetical protein n=1 Tax=Streptomyces TaxID=1883 RepID=UPI001319C5CF|nr:MULTISPECIES: hypothetical protein [unclassified Streptomyces]MZF54378.1 hypothetical protein [Streptomyces sp. SID5594]